MILPIAGQFNASNRPTIDRPVLKTILINGLEFVRGQITSTAELDAQEVAIAAHLRRPLSALVRLAGDLSL